MQLQCGPAACDALKRKRVHACVHCVYTQLYEMKPEETAAVLEYPPRRGSGFFYTPSTDTGKPGTPGYCGTRVPVIPFPAIVVNQRLACYCSTRYAASMQLRSLGTQQARRAQLHGSNNSTRRSASPHAAGLRSCRRSARLNMAK